MTMTTTAASDSWLICSRPKPSARLHLFCFPYAGGNASLFRTWSHELPRDVAVYSVRLPGRESRVREPLFTRLSPLVETLAHVLLPYLDVPFAFFGHSMGALISFELARYIRSRHGLCPAHLFVSAHRAPQLPDPDPPIYGLPEPAFVQKLRSLNGTPAPVLQNAELMRLVSPILRADFAICETYTYAPAERLDCPISAFGGLQDDTVSYDELLAWRQQTHGSFILRLFPGDHFFLHGARKPLLEALSEDLCGNRDYLSSATSSSSIDCTLR